MEEPRGMTPGEREQAHALLAAAISIPTARRQPGPQRPDAQAAVAPRLLEAEERLAKRRRQPDPCNGSICFSATL
jgi:hypothetical protein